MTEHQFNTIFKQYRISIFNFVNKMIKDRYQAEEITSLVFIKMWNVQPVFLTEENTKAWVYIAAKRKTLDYIKHRDRSNIETIEEDEFDLTYADMKQIQLSEAQTAAIENILRIIKKYTHHEQEIFDLHYVGGLKPGEIARILKSKPQTVRNQLTTIRNKIKNEIKKGQ